MYSFVVIQIGGTICSVWTQHLVHEALESIRGSEQAKRKCDNYFIVNYFEQFASYAQVTPRAVNAPSRQAAYQNGAHQRSGFCHDPSEWWVYLWGFQCFFLGHPGSPSGHVPVTRTSNMPALALVRVSASKAQCLQSPRPVEKCKWKWVNVCSCPGVSLS